MKKQGTKYNNIITVIDGITFDSKKEARRYQDLKLLQRAGEIKSFDRQVWYTLRPAFIDNEGKKHQAWAYVADFVLHLPDGTKIIEDVKGGNATKTRLFEAKWNFLKYLFRDDKTVKMRLV
jgi:hypothetical protein